MARSYPLKTLLAIVIPISAVLLLALLSLFVCCCCLLKQRKRQTEYSGHKVSWYTGFCGSRKPSYASEQLSSDMVPIKPKSDSSPKGKTRPSHMSQSHAPYPQTSLPEHKDKREPSSQQGLKASQSKNAQDLQGPHSPQRASRAHAVDPFSTELDPGVTGITKSASGPEPSASRGHHRKHSRHLSAASSIPPAQVAPVPPTAAAKAQPQSQPIQGRPEEALPSASGSQHDASKAVSPSAPKSRPTVLNRQSVQSTTFVPTGSGDGYGTAATAASATTAAAAAAGTATSRGTPSKHRNSMQKIDDPQPSKLTHARTHSEGEPTGAQGSSAHKHQQRPQAVIQNQGVTQGRRNESEFYADRLPSGLPAAVSSSPDHYSGEMFGARRQSLEFSDSSMGRLQLAKDRGSISGGDRSLLQGDAYANDGSSSQYEATRSSVNFDAQNVSSLQAPHANTEAGLHGSRPASGSIKSGYRPEPRTQVKSAVSSQKRAHRADSTIDSDGTSFDVRSSDPGPAVFATAAASGGHGIHGHQQSKPVGGPTKVALTGESEPAEARTNPAPYTPNKAIYSARDKQLESTPEETHKSSEDDRFASPGNSISAPKFGLNSSDLGTDDYGLNSPFAWQEVEQRTNPLESYERYQTALDLNPKWYDTQDEYGSQRSDHTYATAKGPSLIPEEQPEQPTHLRIQPVHQEARQPAQAQAQDTSFTLSPSGLPLETPWRSHRSPSTSSRTSSLLFDKRKKPSPKVNKPLPKTPLRQGAQEETEELPEPMVPPSPPQSHRQPQPQAQTPVQSQPAAHAQQPQSPDGVMANYNGQRFQVVFAYKPALEDELQLDTKDVVQVYQVFDDGWCYAKKEGTKQQGICPKVCLSGI